MAKRKSKKLNVTKLVLSIIVIALAVLAVCSLFMPMFKAWTVATKVDLWSATGSDIFTAAFASEASSEMSAGAIALYTLKTGEDTAFVANVGYWLYMLTVLVAVAVLVFAILSLLGLRFKLVNTILGAVLAVMAILAFIFALVIAGKLTSVETVLGQEVGTRCAAQVGVYLTYFGTLIAGACAVCNARAK